MAMAAAGSTMFKARADKGRKWKHPFESHYLVHRQVNYFSSDTGMGPIAFFHNGISFDKSKAGKRDVITTREVPFELGRELSLGYTFEIAEDGTLIDTGIDVLKDAMQPYSTHHLNEFMTTDHH